MIITFQPFQQLYQSLRGTNVKLCQALDSIGTNLSQVFQACNEASSVALNIQGPGPGTYTTGAKLTSGGTPGTITIDQYGRITAIHQAT